MWVVKNFLSSVNSERRTQLTDILKRKLSAKDSYVFEDLFWNRSGSTENLKLNPYITIRLFTPSSKEKPYNLTPVNSLTAPFHDHSPLKVICHGWFSTSKERWMTDMKNAYIELYKCNVVLVDWLAYSHLNYLAATERTLCISKYLAQVILPILHCDRIKLNNVHFIGHSLGAHIVGVCAKYIKAQIGTIDRISALDPARPLFEVPKCSDKKRLKKSDANFVDVIHTCAGGVGFKLPLGHVDFYPNGGIRQPGCITETFSHLRSYSYYLESIRSNRFLATRCESWKKYKKGEFNENVRAYMGAHVRRNAPEGKYYLKTNKKAPFGLA